MYHIIVLEFPYIGQKKEIAELTKIIEDVQSYLQMAFAEDLYLPSSSHEKDH